LTPEGRILADCLRYLKIRGIYHWRNSVGSVQVRPGQWYKFDKMGSSDILGILPDGKILAVECKSERGRLSPEQKQFLETVQGLGGMAIIARSWKDVDQALREAGHVNNGPLFNEAPEVRGGEEVLSSKGGGTKCRK
jgi:hypothetical protein